MDIRHRSDLSAADCARPAFTFKFRPELPEFEKTGCADWNSSTKALAEFLGAIGVSDAGRMARSIIQEFGTLSDLLSASWWRLRRVVGVRLARAIQSSHALTKTMLEEVIDEGPVIRRSQGLVDLLQAKIGFLPYEMLLALYVDSQCRLMRIEEISKGSTDQTSVDCRAIIGCCLVTGASGFVLVHNHPSGIPKPSNADIQVTQKLKSMAAGFDIELLDHFIVARGKLATIFDYWQEARLSQQSDMPDAGVETSTWTF